MKHSTEEDELIFHSDIEALTPRDFLTKYLKQDNLNTTNSSPSLKRQFSDIPIDVICYIILNYLDWKTVFSSCLLVNKEFFRRIANNRQLFIDLFNGLFVMQDEEIENWNPSSKFKYKKINNCNYKDQYGGFGIPNEHYHFCKDYHVEIVSEMEIDHFKKSLKQFHVKNRKMTDSKLRLIRDSWNRSVNVFKKAKNVFSTRSKKEDNQSLLNLIKKIIKDRLFMRKYFNGDLNCVKLEYKGVVQQPNIAQQVQNLCFAEMDEIEEIIVGYCRYSNQVTDDALESFENSTIYTGNISSLISNDVIDTESAMSHLQNPDLKRVFDTFQNLKAFQSRGKFPTITPIKNAHLSVLILVSGDMRRETLSGILACEFPQLKHLELWLGSNSHNKDDELVKLLSPEENGKFPILEYFGLRNTENVERFLAPIAKSNLLKRLRIIDLSLGLVESIGSIPGLYYFATLLEQKGKSSFPLLELVDLHRTHSPEEYIPLILDIFQRLEIMVDLSCLNCRGIAASE